MNLKGNDNKAMLTTENIGFHVPADVSKTTNLPLPTSVLRTLTSADSL